MNPPLGTSTCVEHAKVLHDQTELSTMFKAHAEITRQQLDRILVLLQGPAGTGGLSDRVATLETRLTQTDEHVERLVKAIEGVDGAGGLIGRIGKLERGWALFIGVAVTSGAAGAGFAKLLAFLSGG